MVTEEDYFLLKIWWEKHGWPALPEKFMSKFGIMVEGNEVPLAAGWLYLTGSGWIWFDFIVSNPTAGLKDRTKALDYLVSVMVDQARAFGGGAIHSSLKSRGLIKLFEKYGFVQADKNMTNMVLNLCQSEPQQQ